MISRFKRKKPANYELKCQEINCENTWYVSFQLNRENIIFPTSEWTDSNHLGADWLLNIIVEEEKSYRSMNSVELPVSVLMEKFEGQEDYLRNLLELPTLFNGGLHLESQGLLSGDSYKLNYSWINDNGRPIIQGERRGMFILVGSKKYLLPWHAWKMAESLDIIQESIENSETMHSRLKILEEFKSLKNLLPDEERSKFSENTSIANLKLHYANAFRIEAVPEDFSFKIRPVLLKRRESQNGDSSVYENILPPSEQVKYADNFRKSTQLLPYYSLGVGKYLIINDQLNKALSVVHKIQHASPEERLHFLKNPKGAIAESLDGIIDESDLDQIFSDRVVGIGEWNTKVIPWVQIPPSDWIDGKSPDLPKGIDIGGQKIQLASQKETQELLSKVEDAQKSGLLFVEHEDILIPVNDSTRAAIAKLIPRKPVKAEVQDKTNVDSNISESRITQTPVMLVKENLESVEFSVHRERRTKVPSTQGIPNSVRSTPKEHQEEAFNWLCNHYKAGSRGVLLADDMGLGKTFQSLMFFSWLREAIENGELPEKPLLIIAPTGLLKNWEAEIERHLMRDLGHLEGVYGSGLKTLRSGQALNTTKLQNAGLVLTTYDTLTRYQTSFGVVSFTAVIFDEMQKLKNPGIQNYTAACSLNCDFWIGMTGTPVENRLCDLWAISDVLQPGMLGSIKDFSNKYEKAMLDVDDDARQSIIVGLQNGLTQSSSEAPAFMLRRMKHEKLPGLPPKHFHEYPIQMSSEQIKAYDAVRDNVLNSDNRKGVMLEALHKLRAYSLHHDYKRQQQYACDNDFIQGSARLQGCFKILDEIYQKREKALIFIEYNDWHRPDFLSNMIKSRYSLKELPMVINGQVNSKTRQDRVEEFQKERDVFDVMLLSPRAGGVGLTLTAANHIIHLTRWWNPAVEDQANDRVYRIGQDRPVHIYYPMAIHPDLPNGCFDNNLNQLLRKKRILSEQVLISLPNEEGTLEALMGKTFDARHIFKIGLTESYSISAEHFEPYVIQRLQRVASEQGFLVRATPESYDGGADIIIETLDGQIVALIQCKHVSSEDKTPQDIVSDLERAVANYDCIKPVMKIGITNASKISQVDQQWVKQSDLHKIIYGDQGLKPEVLFRELVGY